MSLLMRGGAAPLAGAAAYDALAAESAALVLRRYSTSFGLASRLLPEPVRGRIQAFYALVRVADEIVDAPRAGAGTGARRAVLDALEDEVTAALRRGHSANLVVHAFVLAARECGVGADLLTPFFTSMRMDLERTEHDEESFAAYVHGSAEVVGLMCLRAFLADEPDTEERYTELAPGAARLGAAFQKVNFLRDLGDDHDLLGRSYFPGVDLARLDDATRDRLLADVTEDLRVAALAVAGLPPGSRRAVRVAHTLYGDLVRRIGETPAAELRRRRVRVPGPAKARIVARCLAAERAAR
ncbi:squalene/phytoene synthase family protein [Nocardioides sp. zg-ZUI104]|uniref:phytoene/squalene synthase family protein n=1 Tax=Nocardioides faecalis TaxID=2803858 RepID=UPI001BCEC6C4|nr:squalene/phytoene synthase family protein [Nocardioides faecalis]MBS4753979.1 squalene/phytoene synthase family protein [Nocardioides faecalis]